MWITQLQSKLPYSLFWKNFENLKYFNNEKNESINNSYNKKSLIRSKWKLVFNNIYM